MKKNTLHIDPIHLPRDPIVLPTEITGTKENNESKNIREGVYVKLEPSSTLWVWLSQISSFIQRQLLHYSHFLGLTLLLPLLSLPIRLPDITAAEEPSPHHHRFYPHNFQTPRGSNNATSTYSDVCG